MVNSLENFKYVFDKALEGKFIDRMDQNQEIFARYMNDPAFAKVVAEFLRKQVYEQIRSEKKEIGGPLDRAAVQNGKDLSDPLVDI